MEVTCYLLAIVLMWLLVTTLRAERLHHATADRVATVERKLGLLLGHFALIEGLPPWKRLALDPSSKLHAIAAYQKETGADLAEAKRAVEHWIERL